MTNHQFTDHPSAPDIESSTKDYATRFIGEVGEWFVDVQCQGTKALLRKAGLISKGLKVLDVGGGHGQNIKLMKALAHELTIVGSDVSCKALFADAVSKNELKFIESKLTALPFENKEFDIVLCYRIMAHIDDWELLTRELSRVAKSLVIIEYTSASSVNAFAELLFTLKKKVEKNTRFYRLHRTKEVLQAFTHANMLPVAKFSQYFFPMAIHRALKSKGVSKLIETLAKCVGLTHFFGSPVLYAFKPNSSEALPKSNS